MWRQSLAEKTGAPPSEVRSPDRTPFAREGSADGSIATDKDDPAAVFHFFGGCLDTDEGGADIDGDHAVEVFETVGVDCAHSENASIADEDVFPAQFTNIL
jgi:hypothetical protein